MLICVKSKHGCSSGMMSWTDVVENGVEKDWVGYLAVWEHKGFLNVGE